MSAPANFNGQRPVIDVNDSAMLLIDHQSGLFQTIGDMPMPVLRRHAATLAKMATLSNIPVITTAEIAGKAMQTLVMVPAMIRVFLPVAFTAATKSGLSHALISPLRAT